jgi:hypothetical protein
MNHIFSQEITTHCFFYFNNFSNFALPFTKNICKAIILK